MFRDMLHRLADPREPEDHVYRQLYHKRFQELIEKRPDGHWLWEGGGAGWYGVLTLRGQPPIRAHRVSWALYRGPVPVSVRISCGRKTCVAPDHLYDPATQTREYKPLPKMTTALELYILTRCTPRNQYFEDKIDELIKVGALAPDFRDAVPSSGLLKELPH